MGEDKRPMDVGYSEKCKTESHTKIEHTRHGAVKSTVTTKREK